MNKGFHIPSQVPSMKTIKTKTKRLLNEVSFMKKSSVLPTVKLVLCFSKTLYF